MFKLSYIISVVSLLSFMIACKELNPQSDGQVKIKKESLLGKISLEEAKRYYDNILVHTPVPSGLRNSDSGIRHPIEKESNFDAAFTYQLPNVAGNIAVVPIRYKMMDSVMYLAGEEARQSVPKKHDFRKGEVNHLNNLIIFKPDNGKIESCIQRIISFDTKKKKQKEGIKWKDFKGLVEYFDWNENFLFGFVVTNGKVTGSISSITQKPTDPKSNGRTLVCNGIETCFSYYACSRNSQTGALENCSDVTTTCSITNVICVDTNDPNSGYSVPPGMGGTYVDPNNPAVAAIWDRGQVVNQIMNNPMSLLKTQDCPQNVAAWANLAQFIPPQTVRDRLAQLNQGTLFNNYQIQALDKAEGMVVNCDYFSVKINTLPSGFQNNPVAFLEYIRKNFNSFAEGPEFAGHPKIANENTRWLNNPLGSIVFIDITGPENASVVTSAKSQYSWVWSTIQEPYAGFHPVSGTRAFGYKNNGDGSFTFYTQGVDRVHGGVEEVVGKILSGYENAPLQYELADGLWGSFTKKIRDYVNSHNGASTLNAPVVKRPDYYEVKDVLDGKKPLSEIKCP